LAAANALGESASGKFIFFPNPRTITFPSGFHLANKFARKFSGTDLSQCHRHLFADLVIYNFWSNREIAPLGGVGNQVAHPCDSCFVDHIDNKFQFVQALEVGQLWGITGTNQSLERGSNERGCSATQYCLLPEQICLRFFPKSCFDDAGPGAPDCFGPCECKCARLPTKIVFHSEQGGHAAASLKLTPHHLP
jgi:hypothetical protein